MDLNQAAYIIGSLGGRPLKNPSQYPIYRRGGGGFDFFTVYTTEDLIPYTDEFGIDFYVTENA